MAKILSKMRLSFTSRLTKKKILNHLQKCNCACNWINDALCNNNHLISFLFSRGTWDMDLTCLTFTRLAGPCWVFLFSQPLLWL